jgi:hypothetical protein
MLYPHEYDRHQLIALIFKALRKERDWNQHALATYAEVNQAVISAIETLPEAKRSLSRQDFIKTIRPFNFSRPAKKVNAILWLFDGEPLTADERKEFNFRKISQDKGKGSEEIKTIFELLQQAMRHYKRQPGKCVSVVSENEDDELAIYKEFLAIESGRGIRMLIKRTPSSLTYPATLYEGESGVPKKITTKAGKETYLAIRKKRIENYLEQFKIYGDRCIHVEEDIEAYLSCKENYPFLSKKERRAHIQNLIKLLEENPDHFQIKLVKKLPLFEYGMKGFDKVVTTAEFYPSNLQLVRYIQLFGEQSVLPYLLEFENLWNELSEDQPDNKAVIKKLNGILKSTS